MGGFKPNTEMLFKGSNSPKMGLSWCKGIMTPKKCFLNFIDVTPVKIP